MVPQCRLCGARALVPLAEFRHLTVARCPDCRSGLVTGLRESRSNPEAHEQYAEDYEREHHRRKAADCWQLFLNHTCGLAGVRRVLDVGCGTGEFLDLARHAGLETAGIELSHGFAAAAERKGHQILCGSASQVCFPENARFEAVVMWDLLEHLADPGQSLELVHRMLTPGGRLFILTPRMGSIFDRAAVGGFALTCGYFDQLARMCWNHDHLFRFDPTGLCSVLRRLGFTRAVARPIRLLSLDSSLYAGGRLMPCWTRSARLNRCISRLGVAIAGFFNLSNKIFVEARKEAL